MVPRTAVLIATLMLATSGTFARDAPPVSTDAQEHLAATLPKYDRKAAEAARKAAETPEPDPDVIVLPGMTVIERQQMQMKEEDLYRHGYFDDKLVNEELSDFDRNFLNRFRIPIIGISNRQRAREKYLERKNREFREHVKDIANVLQTTNPAEAKRLREALYRLE